MSTAWLTRQSITLGGCYFQIILSNYPYRWEHVKVQASPDYKKQMKLTVQRRNVHVQEEGNYVRNWMYSHKLNCHINPKTDSKIQLTKDTISIWNSSFFGFNLQSLFILLHFRLSTWRFSPHHSCASTWSVFLFFFFFFFWKRFIVRRICTVCKRIHYKIVPVTNLNKYLHYCTSGTEYIYTDMGANNGSEKNLEFCLEGVIPLCGKIIYLS